jgi:hypothetical protein
MQHSLHLYLGDELSPIAEAVNRHLNQHCDREGREFSHVAIWLKDGSNSVVRQIDSGDSKTVLSSQTEGKAYFEQKHNKIVVAHPGGEVSPYLYVCIYVLLYDKTAIGELQKIMEWVHASGKPYVIDVYGASEDLAFIFCTTESERHDLIFKNEEMKAQTASTCKQLVRWKEDSKLRHFILIQNSNVIGLGLDIDKNTLIRIFGEYARLSTTNFSDIFPIADIDRPDVMALGISAYWFSQKFFQEYIFRSCLIKLFEREHVDQHSMSSPNSLLKHLQAYIDKHRSILSNAVINIDTKDKASALSEFDLLVNEATNDFLQVIERTELSLPEKRAMLAMFFGDDDELLDDSVLLKDLPTIDDCMAEALNLFIDENNEMIEDGGGGVLSVPIKDGEIYLPLEDLRKKRTIIRQSHSFIRQKEERLREIEKSTRIIEESHKRLTEQGFVYGDTTFKLIHDVVEKPLEETYVPNVVCANAVDLRKGFSVIRNQGKLGACTSFSMASIFEYILNQGEPTKRHCLSPRFLYYIVSDKNNDGTIIDKGSSFYDNIHVLGKLGICEENLCPYDDKFNTSPSDEAKEDALSRLVTKAENVKISHRDLTAALTEGYPIGISLKVFDSFGKNQKGFIFRPTDKELKSTDFGYHAMVICGYSEKEKVYIVRNSWGEAFGDKGYCYIPFSYIEDKSLCRQACIVTGISCGDIKGISTDVPKFDIENKDVEYAVLRILIDEEKLQLKQYRTDYNECYRGYMTLLGELTNKGKRDAIMNHALGKIQPKMTTQQVTEAKQVSTNKNLYVIIGLIIAALFFFILSKEQKLAGTLVPLIISVLLWWKYPSTKTVEETKTIEVSVVPKSAISVELKFLFAGRLIDSFNKVRNSLSDKHKYLQSYILNLETWLNEERSSLNSMDEHIRKPFYSLFSNEQADRFLSMHSISYLDDLWLFKRFADYDITDNAIIGFKKTLYNDLKEKTSSISRGFSMYDYIDNTDKYNYLPNVVTDRIFTTIENMSVPFAQGILHPHPKRILFCFVEAVRKDIWQELIGTKYTTLPALANDVSTQKITFIQIQKYNLNETVYGE